MPICIAGSFKQNALLPNIIIKRWHGLSIDLQ